MSDPVKCTLTPSPSGRCCTTLASVPTRSKKCVMAISCFPIRSGPSSMADRASAPSSVFSAERYTNGSSSDGGVATTPNRPHAGWNANIMGEVAPRTKTTKSEHVALSAAAALHRTEISGGGASEVITLFMFSVDVTSKVHLADFQSGRSWGRATIPRLTLLEEV